MENVPQLMRFKRGEVFNRFISGLTKAGYYTNFDVLFGPEYGLPQGRSRLVLLASRLGNIGLPKPPRRKKHRTVRDAIGKLAPLVAGQEDGRDRLHRASHLSEINLKRIRAAKPGGSWKDWDDELVAECHKLETGRGYASVYGRMKWDEPSPTITTQFYGFGNGRFGHPEQDRALSLREGAILQGFPRSYEFVPPNQPISTKHVGQMIGNAVPVTLAKSIAKTVAYHLRENYDG
jgi:DNA (cytosine-5)-methyltransferase 1